METLHCRACMTPPECDQLLVRSTSVLACTLICSVFCQARSPRCVVSNQMYIGYQTADQTKAWPTIFYARWRFIVYSMSFPLNMERGPRDDQEALCSFGPCSDTLLLNWMYFMIWSCLKFLREHHRNPLRHLLGTYMSIQLPFVASIVIPKALTSYEFQPRLRTISSNEWHFFKHRPTYSLSKYNNTYNIESCS